MTVVFEKGFDVLDDLELPNGRRLIQKEIRVRVGGVYVVVKAGDTTDYSSVPWWARPFVNPLKINFAGTVHDKLYQDGVDGYGNKITRRQADMVWRLIAEYGENRANKAQSYSYWLGLRIGGWRAWNKYRKAQG